MNSPTIRGICTFVLRAIVAATLIFSAGGEDRIDGDPPELERGDLDSSEAEAASADDFSLDDYSFSDKTASESSVGQAISRPSVTLKSDYFGYYETAPDTGDDHLGRGDLEVRFEGLLGSGFSYVVAPRLRWDSGDNTAERFEFREHGQRRPLATLQEAKVTWASEHLEIMIGKDVFNWGVADAYSPVDNLNPWDYLDVPTSERIGVPALSLYHFNELFEIQGVWQPWFSPSRIPLPGFENRWLGDFQSFLASSNGNLGIAPGSFSFDGVRLPSDSLDNSQFGLRLSSSKLIDGWDLGLIYNRGHQSTGVFRGDLTPAGIVASLRYPQYYEVGASFSTVLGEWQVHGEGSYHSTNRKEMDDDYIDYIVGVNRTFSDLPIPGVEETRLIVEYAGEEITREISAGSPYLGSRQFSRPFEDALIGNLTFKFSEETEAALSGSYDFADDGWMFEASLSHKFSSNFKAQAGTQYFGGPKDSFIGKWDANDRFFLSLTHTY